MLRKICLLLLFMSAVCRLLEPPRNDRGVLNLRKKLDQLYADEVLVAQNKELLKKLEEQLDMMQEHKDGFDENVSGAPPPPYTGDLRNNQIENGEVNPDVIGIPEVINDVPYHTEEEWENDEYENVGGAAPPHPRDPNVNVELQEENNEEDLAGAPPPHPNTDEKEDNAVNDVSPEDNTLENNIEGLDTNDNVVTGQDSLTDTQDNERENIQREHRKLSETNSALGANRQSYRESPIMNQNLDKNTLLEFQDRITSKSRDNKLKLLQRMYPEDSTEDLLYKMKTLEVNRVMIDEDLEFRSKKGGDRLIESVMSERNGKRFGKKKQRSDDMNFSDIEELENIEGGGLLFSLLTILLMVGAMGGVIFTGMKMYKILTKPKPKKHV